MNILIKNGFIATMDKKQKVYRKGSLLIQNDRIAALSETVPEPQGPCKVIDASHMVVMPGFVNTHAHLQQYFRGLYELIGEFYDVNLPLEGYRQPEDMEFLAMASCAEFIYGGCTTSLVIYTYPDGFAQAAEHSGGRFILGSDIEEVDLARLRTGVYEYLPEKGKAGFQRAVDLHKNWHGKGNGRITTIMAPKASDLALPDTYLKCKTYAVEHGLRMSTHLAQSGREYRQVQKLYGKTPPQHLNDLGVLNENLVAAHCAYATEKDFQLIERSGAGILQCRYLFSPFLHWRDRGIRIGLGTDDYFHDMFQLFKELLMGQSVRAQLAFESADQMFSSSRVTSQPAFYELLEFATRGGAEALGIDDQVGSLEVGKKADVILMNMQNPFLTPTLDPLTSLVLYGSSADVDTVIVDGQILKEARRFTTIDLEKALASAQERVEYIRDRFFKDYPHQRDIWENRVPYMRKD